MLNYMHLLPAQLQEAPVATKHFRVTEMQHIGVLKAPTTDYTIKLFSPPLFVIHSLPNSQPHSRPYVPLSSWCISQAHWAPCLTVYPEYMMRRHISHIRQKTLRRSERYLWLGRTEVNRIHCSNAKFRWHTHFRISTDPETELRSLRHCF